MCVGIYAPLLEVALSMQYRTVKCSLSQCCMIYFRTVIISAVQCDVHSSSMIPIRTISIR